MVDGPDDDAGEQSEGEASNDPGNLTQALDTLRNELNECLRVQEFTLAVELQQCILRILECLHGAMLQATKMALFSGLGDSREDLANKVMINRLEFAERFDYYSGQLREMATGR